VPPTQNSAGVADAVASTLTRTEGRRSDPRTEGAYPPRDPRENQRFGAVSAVAVDARSESDGI